MLMLV